MPTGTERLNALTRLRREQERTVAFVHSKDERLGMKMMGCATWLHFREWLDHGGEARLLHVNFCKRFTLCRICAARRSVKLVEAYEPKVQSVLQAQPGLKPAVITLTVASGSDPRERLEHLRASLLRMGAAKRKAESNPTKNTPIQWNHVAGSLRSIEATFNPDKGWHLHAHVYSLLSGFVNVYALADEWQRFTGDSRVVDVRSAYGDTRAALHEVIKYACKFSDLDHHRLWDFHTAVNGGRMFDSAGDLHGVPTGELDQDSVEGLTGPYRDWVATWLWMERKYHLQSGPPLSKVSPL